MEKSKEIKIMRTYDKSLSFLVTYSRDQLRDRVSISQSFILLVSDSTDQPASQVINQPSISVLNKSENN